MLNRKNGFLENAFLLSFLQQKKDPFPSVVCMKVRSLLLSKSVVSFILIECLPYYSTAILVVWLFLILPNAKIWKQFAALAEKSGRKCEFSFFVWTDSMPPIWKLCIIKFETEEARYKHGIFVCGKYTHILSYTDIVVVEPCIQKRVDKYKRVKLWGTCVLGTAYKSTLNSIIRFSFVHELSPFTCFTVIYLREKKKVF